MEAVEPMPTEPKHEDFGTTEEEGGVQCAICLAPYRGRVYLSPCFHSFCAACLAAWLDVTLLCPLCKAQPTMLHWGVDTALGILNTITITKTLSTQESSLIGASGSGRTQRTQAGELEDVADRSHGSVHLRSREVAGWRAALKRVAELAEHDEEKKQDVRDVDRTGVPHNDTEDLDAVSLETEVEEVQFRSGSLEVSSSRKRGRSVERNQGPNRRSFSPSFSPSRSRSTSRSRSRSRLRSRSMTPIDSYHHIYDSSELYAPQTNTSSSAGLNTDADSEPSAPGVPPSRRDVYVAGLEPYPAETYPLADQIVATDIPLLTPFLERDLAVLTDSDPAPVDPVVLAHISSVLVNHGGRSDGVKDGKGKARWGVVEKEVAEWVTLTSKDRSRTELEVAEQFVKEIRRIVKKRWGPRQWDHRVTYKTAPSSFPSFSSSEKLF